ncbi:hypothetical protein DFJ73DRAFT_628708 [Zopfochytrium polystomum]|nr:hypothetical protein DFJ73DRAFT_628708 [Zopfochytrium polystomum]
MAPTSVLPAVPLAAPLFDAVAAATTTTAKPVVTSAPAAAKPPAPAKGAAAAHTLIDIRGNTANSNTDALLAPSIVSAFTTRNVEYARVPGGPVTDRLRSIPTLVLYDDRGLDLFDQITYLDEYYLTNAEIDVFERWGDEMMAACVEDGGILVELGVGSMRKTKYLLESLVRQNKSVTYYALDLSEKSLVESLAPLAQNFPSIRCVGLLGTYEDSLAYIRDRVPSADPTTGRKLTRTILWLGSSIGNLTRSDAAAFLEKVRREAMRVGDTFLCGIDRRNDPAVVKLAYDDPKGITRDFCLNGLHHVNRILTGCSSGGKATSTIRVFDPDSFEYVSIYNDVLGRHEAYYRSRVAQTVRIPAAPEIGIPTDVAVLLEEGELINVEYSVKYSAAEVKTLVEKAGFYSPGKWTDVTGRYDVHLFQNPPFKFARALEAAAVDDFVAGIPGPEEFEEMWKAWDLITTTMIPPNKYLEQPISLRHPYIFYLGHIPCFMDIQLSRVLEEPLTEPAEFAEIFERGIDPLMEDPSVCHPHSRVPTEWPSVDAVIKYRDASRERMRAVLNRLMTTVKEKRMAVVGRLARVIWMCYEHDAMHMETLLYMLVQSPSVLPPRDIQPPIGLLRPAATTAEDAVAKVEPAAWSVLPSTAVTIGHDDPESQDGVRPPSVAVFTHTYGWDNERPARPARAPAPSALGTRVEMQNRPVTNAEYFAFFSAAPESERPSLRPASWTEDARSVKSAFGPVPLARGAGWPVFVSHVQATAYAAWAARANGSAPTAALRLPTEEELAVARQLASSGSPSSSESGNFGFSSWVPENVDSRESGAWQGDGWEWTSSVFANYEGFEASKLYPGYSADFFDEKHNVVLGGSWATVPRIAQRKTFRNWYQRGYPYVFATFRLVREVSEC